MDRKENSREEGEPFYEFSALEQLGFEFESPTDKAILRELLTEEDVFKCYELKILIWKEVGFGTKIYLKAPWRFGKKDLHCIMMVPTPDDMPTFYIESPYESFLIMTKSNKKC